MLGFGALGEFALGEGPSEPSKFVGGNSFAQQKVRRGISAAVMATSFTSFVAPPPAKARPVFSTFSTPQRFHQPIANEPTDTWNYSFTENNVRFSGFFDFAAAHCYSTRPQQASWSGPLLVVPTIPPGGTSRRINFRTGMEPVKKVWPKAKPLVDTRIPVPSVPPPTKKVEKVVPPPVVDVLPTGLVAAERVVLDALDVADVQAFLRKHEQKEQDEADIAEVLRLLD